jgi:hypothetical protein
MGKSAHVRAPVKEWRTLVMHSRRFGSERRLPGHGSRHVCGESVARGDLPIWGGLPFSSHGVQSQIGSMTRQRAAHNLRGDMMTTRLKAMTAAAAAGSLTLLGLAVAPAALAGTVSTAAHPIGSGTVTYHFNGKCMDDNHGSSANGTKVQIWTCNGHARSQKWTGYSDGTLRINGKCLDVTGTAPSWARRSKSGHETVAATRSGGSCRHRKTTSVP